MDDKSVYCVLCESKKEAVAELYLRKSGYNVISSLVEMTVIKDRKVKTVLRPIIPGYIFLETEQALNYFEWKKICKVECIYYPLKYQDNQRKLRGKDLEFTHFLKRNKGIIKKSKAVEVGNKVKILEGPLKEFEGKIVKINRRKKYAAVKIEGEGIDKIIWLSYEIIGE